jgi:hypothetical protein
MVPSGMGLPVWILRHSCTDAEIARSLPTDVMSASRSHLAVCSGFAIACMFEIGKEPRPCWAPPQPFLRAVALIRVGNGQSSSPSMSVASGGGGRKAEGPPTRLQDAYTLFQLPLNGAIRSVNSGGDCFGVGGHFTLTCKHADILLGCCRPLYISGKNRTGRRCVGLLIRMMHELREQQRAAFLSRNSSPT